MLTIAVDDILPVHMADALTGEAPFWDAARGTLWWIDIQGQRLLGFEPASGRTSMHRLPLMPGFVVTFGHHGLVLGLEDGIYAVDPATGVGERLFAVEEDLPANRLNDGKTDPAGRLWFGSMDKTGNGAPVGALYSLTPDGVLHRHRSEIRIPNAIAFSPCGRTFYFSDSRSQLVEAFDYDVTSGSFSNGRPFAIFTGDEHPDGACTDADGGVWIAVVNGSRIERRRPDGTVDLVVELPVSRPTMPMLGGRDGRTLFVTSQRRFLGTRVLKQETLAGQLLATRVPSGNRR
ncbi:MAG: SMP-30/gluconolactonase/LRE family protein [Bosea sp.]|uniref:SMP-30/gluconolactonase/LRE family protein n=1 Tax=Bosea sp. (in: a-proteobacteria) TaxID=1871050 RepID=UPI00238B8E16|nr:SMP-30/gluconolactonase/LRE family protein [Bosea sp. (in: a-proteobacteria)]MCP4736513.1 SMP-30/gluconolactonase/LRE family protein [Bosea sp. (in: a-proteobacteria)]